MGELSLKRATCASFSVGHTSSITSHKSNMPASSKLEFVKVPFGLSLDMMLADMSAGHLKWKTVGATAPFPQ